MARLGTMTDMARTPNEVKEEIAENSPSPIGSKMSTAPVYPYGLCLCLEDEALEKLKMQGMPEVGATVHFAALARVTSVSENEREGTDGDKTKCRRVELQITHLAIENEDREASEAWYTGGGKGSAKKSA